MIVCKSPAEIARMRAASELVAAVLTDLQGAIAPGVSTGELDERAEAMIRAAGATPAFKGYHGYPATLCVSLNDEVDPRDPVAEAAAAGGRHRLGRRGRRPRRVRG